MRTKSAFLKLGNRNSMAIAVASIAVRVSLNEIGQVDQVRIALGSVAPTPARAYQAEALLQSNHLTETSIRLAAEAAQRAACPITDLRASAGYRSRLVAVLTRRALEMVESEFSAGNDYG